VVRWAYKVIFVEDFCGTFIRAVQKLQKKIIYIVATIIWEFEKKNVAA
jgi:hypothetical protein